MKGAPTLINIQMEVLKIEKIGQIIVFFFKGMNV